MHARRRIELVLAGLIAGGASFAALAPGAAPYASTDTSPLPIAPPDLPRVSAADFADIEVSDASRAVAAAVISRETRSARFVAPAPRRADPGQAAVSVTPRAEADAGPAWSGEALGVQLTYAPPTGPNEPNWWIIGGGGRESYAVAPGGLREFTVAPVSAETSVGDAHVGIAVEMGDHAYASLGYVREVRKFSLGTDNWEEEEHYLGVGFQARW
ncbi:MAG: hypothetical protein RKE49_13550 [Oceanicaulis sp.]